MARFTVSQGTRILMERGAAVKTLSATPRPAMRYMSSVASSLMTSITSSTVMTPTSFPWWFTTGTARML